LSAEDGVFASLLKPGPRARALWRGALDLIFPPRALDGEAAMAGGLAAASWSRIHFLDGPVCDGCGQPVILLTNRNVPFSVALSDFCFGWKVALAFVSVAR